MSSCGAIYVLFVLEGFKIVVVFGIFSGFGSLQTRLLCIVGDLSGEGSVAVVLAAGGKDR